MHVLGVVNHVRLTLLKKSLNETPLSRFQVVEASIFGDKTQMKNRILQRMHSHLNCF